MKVKDVTAAVAQLCEATTKCGTSEGTGTATKYFVCDVAAGEICDATHVCVDSAANPLTALADQVNDCLDTKIGTFINGLDDFTTSAGLEKRCQLKTKCNTREVKKNSVVLTDNQKSQWEGAVITLVGCPIALDKDCSFQWIFPESAKCEEEPTTTRCLTYCTKSCIN